MNPVAAGALKALVSLAALAPAAVGLALFDLLPESSTILWGHAIAGEDDAMAVGLLREDAAPLALGSTMLWHRLRTPFALPPPIAAALVLHAALVAPALRRYDRFAPGLSVLAQLHPAFVLGLALGPQTTWAAVGCRSLAAGLRALAEASATDGTIFSAVGLATLWHGVPGGWVVAMASAPALIALAPVEGLRRSVLGWIVILTFPIGVLHAMQALLVLIRQDFVSPSAVVAMRDVPSVSRVAIELVLPAGVLPVVLLAARQAGKPIRLAGWWFAVSVAASWPLSLMASERTLPLLAVSAGLLAGSAAFLPRTEDASPRPGASALVVFALLASLLLGGLAVGLSADETCHRVSALFRGLPAPSRGETDILLALGRTLRPLSGIALDPLAAAPFVAGRGTLAGLVRPANVTLDLVLGREGAVNAILLHMPDPAAPLTADALYRKFGPLWDALLQTWSVAPLDGAAWHLAIPRASFSTA